MERRQVGDDTMGERRFGGTGAYETVWVTEEGEDKVRVLNMLSAVEKLRREQESGRLCLDVKQPTRGC